MTDSLSRTIIIEELKKFDSKSIIKLNDYNIQTMTDDEIFNLYKKHLPAYKKTVLSVICNDIRNRNQK